MTRSSKSIYKKADSFSLLAKSKGYRSRSAIKLIELQKKDKLIKLGSKVLDLGSSPGGWSQVAIEAVGEKGLIFAVDLKEMRQIERVIFLKKGINDLKTDDFIFLNKNILPFDVVLSDIAPNISGIREKDDAAMNTLLFEISLCIDNYLKDQGNAICKVFHGESFDNMMNYMKSKFQKVRIRKPDSSRANSKEAYILGIGKKDE